MVVKLKSVNGLIAVLLIVVTAAVFLVVLLRGLGGNEAVFLILGYLAGWLNSVVLFFFRKSPPVEEKGEGK